jgi:putative transposase
MLQRRLGLSERRACAIVGQQRSTQRHSPVEPDPDKELRKMLCEFSRRHPRWGYRRAHAVFCREGHHVNRKNIQRLWREKGLRVAPRRHKRRRLGESTTPADRLMATYPDHVWALDYQFDVTRAGRVLKILHVTDEFTRESLSDLVDHSIDADKTVFELDRLVAERGAATFIRCDNGPKLNANALRDWCRFTGSGTSHIDPGSPWQNPCVESYGSRMRDEHLSIEQFDTVFEAKVLVSDWREEYDTYRPHSALGMLTQAPIRRAMESREPDSAHVAGEPTNGVRGYFL